MYKDRSKLANASSSSYAPATGGSSQPGNHFRDAIEAFQRNFALAIPAVILFVAQIIIVVGVTLGILGTIYFGEGSFVVLAPAYMLVGVLTGFLVTILVGVFSALTMLEADAALSGQAYSMGSAWSQLQGKMGQLTVLVLIVAALEAIWSLVSPLSWLLDGLTNVVFLVSIALLLSQGGEAMDQLKNSVNQVLTYLSADPLSLLALFVAGVFLGFPILEIGAMPLAVLIVLSFMGSSTSQQAGPPAAPAGIPPSPPTAGPSQPSAQTTA
ncbi:MAG: hypothetical protein ACP5UI_02510 [Thermoprotei archaeon]|nr:hypothetical protein [TACK group archaeon]